MEEETNTAPLIDFEAILQTLYEQTVLFGPKILFAIAILVIGNWIAKWLSGLSKKALERRNVEASLVGFLTAIVHAALVTFVILAALSKVGIQTTSFVAVIGAAGLAIGLALQGSLSNFAAGVLIIIFKPYRVGDYVVAGGAEGEVVDIGIFTSTVVTLDNRTQIIPNAVATSGVIENYTKQGTRRLDLVAGVSYGDDIKKVKEILQDILDKEPRVLKDPAPTIGLMEMADSSINFAFRPWVKVEDYWDLFFDLQEQIKIRFDEAGVTIPFPQRDVHLFQEK
ncbi:MAG: mechanosensitive ion channel domain-containing protein [Verrucomicrobiota bacterium]